MSNLAMTTVNTSQGKETQEAELLRLRDALQRIANIGNEMFGGDWDEIEEARQIALDALGGNASKVPTGRWIHVSNRMPEESETFDGRVAAIDADGYAVTALVLPTNLASTSGVEVHYWMALPQLK
jgi:hypothetical protein